MIVYIPLFIIYLMISLVAQDMRSLELNAKVNEEFTLSIRRGRTSGSWGGRTSTASVTRTTTTSSPRSRSS